jgi:CheY-like chemotaxis protein/glycine cleavage system H lipoate-binding protein
MVILIVLVTIITFIVVDLVLRRIMKKIEEKKIRLEREAALDTGLRLEYTDEANSLKRVEVNDPKARILAVDDEAIVLDSFRKILVIAGYSVDTVETGQEAIGLVRKNDYDFVFTDFKMPEMDGVEVTKAVKHLRPDVDVVLITGYASIESAVETMKFGAMDYVEKPFTADELTELVNKLLIRRQARLEAESQPEIRLITPSVTESDSRREFNVPAGVFVSPSHSWLSLAMNGMVRVGIDDFTHKTLGRVDSVELPGKGRMVTKGSPLFSIQQGNLSLPIPSPVSGKVTDVNAQLLDNPELIKLKPYDLGWICKIEPTKLTDDLKEMKVGEDAVAWYREEIERFTKMKKDIAQEDAAAGAASDAGEDAASDVLSQATWDAFSQTFINH